MPKEGEPIPVKQSHSLTLLLDKEKAYAYEGRWEDAVVNNTIVETTYDLLSGMGKRIREKQKALAEKDDLVVIIKPLAAASYQSVITALDEMQINNVKKYALAEASENEASFLQRR
jgi:biopolymer transport protein ExbD